MVRHCGYMSADMLVQSQDTYQVDLVGPARKDQNRGAGALASLGGRGVCGCGFPNRLDQSTGHLSPRAYVSIMVQNSRKWPALRVYQVLA